jgi:hypothetical protein
VFKKWQEIATGLIRLRIMVKHFTEIEIPIEFSNPQIHSMTIVVRRFKSIPIATGQDIFV